MFWSHEEITRFGRMMRGLFGYVIAPCAIWIIPVACESLSEYRIEWLLYSTTSQLAPLSNICHQVVLRRLDMPTTEVEFDNRNKSLYRIFDFGQSQKYFRMCHKARPIHQYFAIVLSRSSTNFVIRSSIDRGSRIKVGSVTLLRSAPGRNWDMMCPRTNISESNR